MADVIANARGQGSNMEMGRSDGRDVNQGQVCEVMSTGS